MPNGEPHYLPLYTGPSFQGFQWCLTGTQGGSRYHLLKILTQVSAADYKANITGNWGNGGNSGCTQPGNLNDFIGHITQYPDDATSFGITVQWSPPASSGKEQTNTLTGNITFLPGQRAGRMFALPVWFLQGSVIVTDDNGNIIGESGYGEGPGYVDGVVRVL